MSDLSTWDRLYVGGSIGAGFSNYATFVDVSPMVGYMLTERWSAGPGYTYQFIRDKVWAESIHITGPRVFSRFGILDWLFLHAEYEHLFYKWRSDVTGDVLRINAPGFYAGAGLRSGFDERSGGFLVVMYNFLETSYTPHSRRNPIIQMGFTIGL